MGRNRRSEQQLPRPLSPAAATPRRAASAGKLSQFFGGSSSSPASAAASASIAQSALQSGLQELATVSKLTLKIADAQRRAMDAMTKWAREAQNAAIDDVMLQTAQIFTMHAGKQQQFVADYDYSVQQLQKIGDADRTVRDAERRLKSLDEREKKLRKEIHRGVSFFRKGGDIVLLRQQLEEVQVHKQSQQHCLDETRAEMEVVKMFHYRRGMQGIADSYRMLAASTAAIYSCHRELTEMVPAISTQDVRRMVYDGAPVTRERVEELRRQLDSLAGCQHHHPAPLQQPSARRRSEPAARSRDRHGTPPPPYTPTAPPVTVAEVNYPVVPRRTTPTTGNSVVQRAAPPPPPVDLQQTPSSRQHLHHHHHQQVNRHSLHAAPCSHCGRIYPELPPNPYLQMKMRQSMLGSQTS